MPPNVSGVTDSIIERQTPSSCGQTTCQLPDEVIAHIFSYLPIKDVRRCALVSRRFRNISDDNVINRNLFINANGKSAAEDFCHVVNSQIITWKEACKYSEIASFFSSIEKKECVRKGNYKFSICGNTIKIQSPEKESILDLEDGYIITHIDADDNFLFVMRNDWVIVKFDYRKSQIVGYVNSAFSKRDTQLDFQGYVGGNPVCNDFCVNEGYIVIRYNHSLDNAFELIPINDPEKNTLFGKVKIVDFVVKNNDVYFLYHNYIEVINIINGTRKRVYLPINSYNPEMKLNIIGDFCLISVSSRNLIYAINLKNPDQYFCLSCSLDIENLSIQGNLILLYGYNTASEANEKSIIIIDIYTGDIVKKFDNISTFDHELFNELVKVVHNNSSSFRFSQDVEEKTFSFRLYRIFECFLGSFLTYRIGL